MTLFERTINYNFKTKIEVRFHLKLDFSTAVLVHGLKPNSIQFNIAHNYRYLTLDIIVIHYYPLLSLRFINNYYNIDKICLGQYNQWFYTFM